MSKWIIYVIGVFFVVGGLDSLIGNKLGLGKVFGDTVNKMGVVMLGVLGIYSLAPAAAGIVRTVITPLAEALRMEPGVFPAMWFAIDMGGFNLATLVTKDPAMGGFAAVVVSSLCGAAISYTIPISVTMIDKRHTPQLSMGILSGVASIPLGCFAGGLVAGLPVLNLLWNLMPLCLLSALLVLGLWKLPALMSKIFTVFGRVMAGLSLIGVLLQGIGMIFGVYFLPGMADVHEALAIVARIVFIMCGGMAILTLLRRLLKKSLAKASAALGINEASTVGMLAGTVSAVIPFSDADSMDKRGLTLVCAYCASGAFVIGGQLGLVGDLAPALIPAFITAKLVAGVLGVTLAALLSRRNNF